ncbi:hypothetical protein KDE12_01450 [Campylobacter sp. faydin G-105]|uniref:hypothetical protein n=1 Tax=Campylobacter anatolicus TaxID=2829105 RepID=UPI001B93A24F|nr:hypothetical protein [Campylobacter anatolicus]MBR8461518.1 hypothetical protein [Campylobacter anatolicus]
MKAPIYDGDDESLAKFIKLLSSYTTDKDPQEFRVLDLAYDLFITLEALAKNHNAMKAKILKIINTKGEE